MNDYRLEPNQQYAQYPPQPQGYGYSPRPRHHRLRWLIALAVLTLAGCFLWTNGSVVGSQPNVFTDVGCSMTVISHGPWPFRLDTDTIRVDGVLVTAAGSGLAPPFGSARVELFHPTTSGVLTICKTFSYDVGPFPGPLTHYTATAPHAA
jgi:hypothetical protein